MNKIKFECTVCGEDRPCAIEIVAMPHSLNCMIVDKLGCILDETNHSCSWAEVEQEATIECDMCSKDLTQESRLCVKCARDF